MKIKIQSVLYTHDILMKSLYKRVNIFASYGTSRYRSIFVYYTLTLFKESPHKCLCFIAGMKNQFYDIN